MNHRRRHIVTATLLAAGCTDGGEETISAGPEAGGQTTPGREG